MVCPLQMKFRNQRHTVVAQDTQTVKRTTSSRASKRLCHRGKKTNLRRTLCGAPCLTPQSPFFPHTFLCRGDPVWIFLLRDSLFSGRRREKRRVVDKHSWNRTIRSRNRVQPCTLLCRCNRTIKATLFFFRDAEELEERFRSSVSFHLFLVFPCTPREPPYSCFSPFFA